MSASERKCWCVSDDELIVEFMRRNMEVNKVIGLIGAIAIFSSSIDEINPDPDDLVLAVLKVNYFIRAWEKFARRLRKEPPKTTYWIDEGTFREAMEDGTAVDKICAVIRKLHYVSTDPFRDA